MPTPNLDDLSIDDVNAEIRRRHLAILEKSEVLESDNWMRLQDRVLAFSGSALALSILTLQVENPDPDTKGGLILAWVLLGVGLGVDLLDESTGISAGRRVNDGEGA